MVADIVLILIAIVTLVLVWLKWNHNHWKNKGVPYVEPNILFGTMTDTVYGPDNMGVVAERHYNMFPGEPAAGIFRLRQPVLLLRDLDMIKQIMVTDFGSFKENSVIITKEADPYFGRNPFFLSGDEWKETRQVQTHSHTANKLKSLFGFMEDVKNELIAYVNKNIDKTFDAQDFSGRFTTDVVSSCVFGLKTASISDEESDFRKHSLNILNMNWKMWLFMVAPHLINVFRIQVMPKDCAAYFQNLVEKMIEHRKTNNLQRADFLQNLISDKTANYTAVEMTSQTLTFFVDGYATTAAEMSFVLFMIATHPEVQDRLREEINSADKLDFDTIHRLPYLEAVFNETLRLFPAGVLLSKRCTQDTKVTCKSRTFEFKKGDAVDIPVYAIHRDPQYFPDPLKFDPNRFLENPNQPAFLGFGAGPRACLGMRFAKTQIKTGIIYLVKEFNILPGCKDTSLPTINNKKSILLSPDNEMSIKFVKLAKCRNNKNYILHLLYQLVLVWLKWNHNHWKNKGVPYVEPNILFGTMKDTVYGPENLGVVAERHYNMFPGEPAAGTFRFRQPVLLLRDLDMIKQILVTDFGSFKENRVIISKAADPYFGRNPFFQTGDEWKETRQVQTHSHTANKLKSLFGFMEDVKNELIAYVNKNIDKTFDAQDFSGRFTTDVVSSCVFGLKTASIADEESDFRKHSLNILKMSWKMWLFMFAPHLINVFRIQIIPKDCAAYFQNLVEKMIEHRKTNNLHRADFLQNLISDKTANYTAVEMTSQTLTFFVDGYATTAAEMSFVLFMIATHPEVQDRLREEINSADKLDFDTIHRLPYLEAVLNETLRLFPAGVLLRKRCTQDTKITSKSRTFEFKKGDAVDIPVYAIHRDPQYFPDPLKFDPNRFLENPNPPAFLAFGAGPRACLGMRFAKTQIKTGVIYLVKEFNILPGCKDTSLPTINNKKSVLLCPDNEMSIKFVNLAK